MVVDGSQVHLGFTGDQPQGRLRETPLGKQDFGCIQDLVSGIGLGHITYLSIIPNSCLKHTFDSQTCQASSSDPNHLLCMKLPKPGPIPVYPGSALHREEPVIIPVGTGPGQFESPPQSRGGKTAY